MADTFFGFSTELPQFEDEKSKIFDDSLGGLEDDVIDSLNEDTFGTGALENDWESAHQKLAGLAEEIRNEQKQKSYKQEEISSDPEEDFLEEAITRFVLDEGVESPDREESPVPYRDSYGGKSQAVPIKPVRASVWAGSPIASPTECAVSPSLEQLISPSTNIWSIQYQHGNDMGSRDPLNIHRDQQQRDSSSSQQASFGFSSPGVHAKPPARVIRLEDLEKGLTGEDDQQNVPVTPIGRPKHEDVPERDAPHNGSSPYPRHRGTPYGMQPPLPGLQMHPGMSPGMPVHPMHGQPPGFLPPHLQHGPPSQGYPRAPFQRPRWNMMTPPSHMLRQRPPFFHTDPGHLHHRGMQEHRYMTPQGYNRNGQYNQRYPDNRYYDNRYHDQHYHDNNRHNFPYYDNGLSRDDEYAGLMTQKEKEWLIRIQLLQLTSVNPDLDDYYYQRYISNKAARERAQHGEGVEQRNNSNGDGAAELPHFPHREERSYKTVEFEGSLGKVSVGSVNHPRQIVDNPKDAPSFYHDKSVSGSQKESRRKGGILLTVESIYNILLILETIHKKVLHTPEEDREMLYKERNENISQIFNLLQLKKSTHGTEIEDEFFMQILTYRKGKNVLHRILPIFNTEQGELVLLSITKNVTTLMKKDSQEEVLLHSISALCRSIHLSSPPIITACLKNMVFGTSQLQTLLQIVSNKFGISILTALLQRGLDIKNSINNDVATIQMVWPEAVERVSKEVQEAPTKMLAKGLPATITLIQFLALHTNRQSAALLQEKLRVVENNKEE